MSVRYAFGPKIVGTYGLPPVAEAPDDVQVTAEVTDARSSGAGVIDLDVTFGIPASYDPSKSRLAEVHAISFGTRQLMPTDPSAATLVAQPKAQADASAIPAGGSIVVTIPSAAVGAQTIVTVLGFVDPTPAVASPVDVTPNQPGTDVTQAAVEVTDAVATPVAATPAS